MLGETKKADQEANYGVDGRHTHNASPTEKQSTGYNEHRSYLFTNALLSLSAIEYPLSSMISLARGETDFEPLGEFQVCYNISSSIVESRFDLEGTARYVFVWCSLIMLVLLIIPVVLLLVSREEGNEANIFYIEGISFVIHCSLLAIGFSPFEDYMAGIVVALKGMMCVCFLWYQDRHSDIPVLDSLMGLMMPLCCVAIIILAFVFAIGVIVMLVYTFNQRTHDGEKSIVQLLNLVETIPNCTDAGAE